MNYQDYSDKDKAIGKVKSKLPEILSGGVFTSIVALFNGFLSCFILVAAFKDFATFRAQDVTVTTTVLWILAAFLAFLTGLWCSRSNRAWGLFFGICFLNPLCLMILGASDSGVNGWSWFSLVLTGGCFFLAYKYNKSKTLDLSYSEKLEHEARELMKDNKDQ